MKKADIFRVCEDCGTSEINYTPGKKCKECGYDVFIEFVALAEHLSVLSSLEMVKSYCPAEVQDGISRLTKETEEALS